MDVSRTVSEILTRKARRPLTRDRPRCPLSRCKFAVRTGRTYVPYGKPYVRPVRQYSFTRNAFLPYGPYVRLVRMGQPHVRAVHATRRSFLTAVRTAVRTARTYGCPSTLAVRTARTYRPYARTVRTAPRYGQSGRGSRTCDPSVIFDSRTYGPYVRPVHTAVHPH